MPRVKSSVASRQRRKRLLKLAKGYVGPRSRCYRNAKETVIRALNYAYRDRRVRKRDFRSLWIMRINAAARLHGLSYSRLVNGLTLAGVEIDRKVLAQLAIEDAVGFTAIVDSAKAALASPSVS